MKYMISENEMIFLDGNPTNVSIRCDKGLLWVTQAEDAKDHFLQQGDTFQIKRKGKIAVTGYQDSTVTLVEKGPRLKVLRQSNPIKLNYLGKSSVLSALASFF